MKDADFILRMRRQYTDSEIIGLLDNRISELELELGQANSEIAFLEFKVKEFEKAITEVTGKKGWAKDFLKERYVKELKDNLAACNKQKIQHDKTISKLRNDVTYWQSKYNALNNEKD